MLSSRKRFKTSRKGRIRSTVKDQKSSLSDTNLIQFSQAGIFTDRQFETIKRILRRQIRKVGQAWARVYVNHLRTKKPEKARMGKGKGRVFLKTCYVRPGKTLFELRTLNTAVLKLAFKKISYKLPLKLKLSYSKNEFE